jgi:hypothetical protein
MNRPLLFVGSSAEGLDFAKALQQNLDHALEVVLWSQGVFGLSGGTLETLVQKLETIDFAALVLTPDDLVESRGSESHAPRDNVLLELGMCIGALGRERTFIVHDRSKDLKLPSDLAGITAATFQPHSDGNLQASLGAACSQIEQSTRRLGERTKLGQIGLIDQVSQFRVIADLLGVVADNFLIQLFLSGSRAKREEGLFRDSTHWYGIDFPGRHMGNGRFSVDQMCISLCDADIVESNLCHEIGLTTRGKQFAQWLIDSGYRAPAFDSSVGGWGELSQFISHGVSYFQQELASSQSLTTPSSGQAATDVSPTV